MNDTLIMETATGETLYKKAHHCWTTPDGVLVELGADDSIWLTRKFYTVKTTVVDFAEAIEDVRENA